MTTQAESQAAKDTVLLLLSENKTLEYITKLPGAPKWRTIWGWLRRDSKFAADYARAKACSAEGGYEEIRQIERRMTVAKHIARRTVDGEGNEVTVYDPNPEYIDPMTGRVLIDSIKWRLARLRPKVYGERLEIEHSGSVEVKPSAQAPDWMTPKLAPPSGDDNPTTGPGSLIEGTAEEVATH